MKRQTKADKFRDLANAVNQINNGEKVRRIGARDGSVPTRSTVNVPDILEKFVLAKCLAWLKKRHIFCNRHDVGAGDIAGFGYATYGIKNAGDIIGLTKSGVHFELEVKRGKGGRLSKGQQGRMENIRRNNGVYLVIHGIFELECYNEQHHYFD